MPIIQANATAGSLDMWCKVGEAREAARRWISPRTQGRDDERNLIHSAGRRHVALKLTASAYCRQLARLKLAMYDARPPENSAPVAERDPAPVPPCA